MIKFFRRSRQRLVSGNKPTYQGGRFSKYLIYAIGEIVLVVIGILIALSINTWNETRKQHITEKEIINGIKNDLIKDKAYIETVIELAEAKNSVFTILNQEIFDYYNNNRRGLDSLLVEYFKTQRTFYPIFGSFQSAISGNEISKFKNKRFSSEVTKLYNSTYTRLMDNAKSADEKWHYLTKKYSDIRRTDHLKDMSKPQLDELLNDMFYHMFSLNYYRDNLNKTIVEIDNLLLEH